MDFTQYHLWKKSRHDQELLHDLLFYRSLGKQEKEGIYPVYKQSTDLMHELKQLRTSFGERFVERFGERLEKFKCGISLL